MLQSSWFIVPAAGCSAAGCCSACCKGNIFNGLYSGGNVIGSVSSISDQTSSSGNVRYPWKHNLVNILTF